MGAAEFGGTGLGNDAFPADAAAVSDSPGQDFQTGFEIRFRTFILSPFHLA